MKKIILALVLISFLSCKKEWFDYTNKYTGNFEFDVYKSYFMMNSGVSSDTHYVYLGTIEKIKRGKIKIKYGAGKNDYFDTTVDKEGHIGKGSMGGTFSDYNNMKLGLDGGGLGGGSRCGITGVRK